MEKGNSIIGILNLFLIAFSFLISFLYPINTFILAYAILGPLHYLTQLNWLNTKPFFRNERILKPTFIVLAGLATLFFIFESYSSWKIDWTIGRNFMASIVLLSILVTIFSFTKSNIKAPFIILPTIVIAFLLSTNVFYLILLGVLFVSVVHVYIFTLLHMTSGYLKNKSKVDFINIVLMTLIPLIIFWIPFPFSEGTLSSIGENRFITSLNQNLAFIIGDKNLDVQSILMYKLSWFVSFAYLYHYLNWFSKTKIIHWSDGLTRKKTILICSVSLAFSSIYLLGFEYGIIATLFLSYLHVFAELPLNYISIKNITQNILKK